MIDLKGKLKRQIEIVGICVSQNYLHPLKTFDLADHFNVEELTIKRDLQDLRSSGIDIHSTKKQGICLNKELDEYKLRELIHQYSALCYSDKYVEKSTLLLVNRLGSKALANIVTLQKCIDNNRAATIDYEKESDEVEFGREIFPVLIFQSDGYWRVLAMNQDKLKQFHMNKIIEARVSQRTFHPVSKDKIDDIFKYSWRSWLGPERHNVTLRFSKYWAEWLKPKQLMDSEKFTELNDGSLLFETIVNSLEEIAGWIVSKGEGIIVLEPPELKEKVIQLAKGALKNYPVTEGIEL